MKTVTFLSENRPGPHMGMGYAERMLLSNLEAADQAGAWRFNLIFSGRARGARSGHYMGNNRSRFEFLGFSTQRISEMPWFVARTAVRIACGRSRPNLYHSLSLSFPAPASCSTVLTIHDLPPARFLDEGTIPSWGVKAAQGADAIITPSTFAKSEVVELLGVPEEKVHVVPNGVDHETFNTRVEAASAETLESLGLGRQFIMYVGGGTQRKNVRGLLQAWQKIICDYPNLSLGLAGPLDRIGPIVHEMGPTRTVLLGQLERSLLASVVRASKGVVIPSLYEGFGLPVVEAMALGVPVVAVRTTAIPEVAGGAALLVDDGSPEKLEEGIRQILSNDRYVEELRSKGILRAQSLSWKSQAESVLGIYEKVMGEYAD